MAAPPELTSIKIDDDKLEIVNQLLLPHVTEYVQINTVEDAYDAIKSMKVTSPCPSGKFVDRR